MLLHTYNALAMNTHATQPHQMTKLPIKQFQSGTTPKIHREPFPPKFWQQISQSQQNLVRMTHSSISTPVVHKGEVLLAKNYCSLAKSKKWDSFSNTEHVLTILNNK